MVDTGCTQQRRRHGGPSGDMIKVTPGAEAASVGQDLSHDIRLDPRLGHQRKMMGPPVLRGSERGGPPASESSKGGAGGLLQVGGLAFPFRWFPLAPPQEAAAKGAEGSPHPAPSR